MLETYHLLPTTFGKEKEDELMACTLLPMSVMGEGWGDANSVGQRPHNRMLKRFLA